MNTHTQTSTLNLTGAATQLKHWQDALCESLCAIDPSLNLHADPWNYHAGDGGGETRIITNSSLIENGGINFSHIKGPALPISASNQHPHSANTPFEAVGVSTVIHPYNPYVPTSHANLRCIVLYPQDQDPVWWFGGGFDLTPYYGFDEDCVSWHQHAQAACAPFGTDVYPRYKKWADEYFYLPHRSERRGIGGLFFDDLNCWDFSRCLSFIQNVGQSYLNAYADIIKKRQHTPYTARETAFQHYRRGRYVEFNLLYDRGTLFGLQSNGRTESILMSLPKTVNWHYNFQAEPNSPEARLTEHTLQITDWLQQTASQKN